MEKYRIHRTNREKATLFEKTYPKYVRHVIEDDFNSQLEKMQSGQQIVYGKVTKSTFTPTVKIVSRSGKKMIETIVNGKLTFTPYNAKKGRM